MAAITASAVNELRQRTGMGMMECKKALTEAGGDIDKAIDALRKSGAIKQAKLGERQTSEGRVSVAVTSDNRAGAAVEVLCNTDFTAKSEVVQKLLDIATAKAAGGVADLKSDAQITEAIANASQQTGENVQLGKVARIEAGAGNKIGGFLYTVTGKIGVLVNVSENASDEVIRNLCLHIVASRPMGLAREAIPADLVAKEREIAIEQAKATGKPQEIAEKIAGGKMNSFFAERVLLDQEFVRPDVFKGSVSAYLKQNNVTLHGYERVEVGE